MKTTIAFLFITLFSLSSYSQIELDKSDPLIGSWVIASDFMEGDKFPFNEPISAFTFNPEGKKCSLVTGANLDAAPEFFRINMNENGIMVLEFVEGSRHEEKIGSKFLISIIFDPATDALFVTTKLSLEVGEEAKTNDQGLNHA